MPCDTMRGVRSDRRRLIAETLGPTASTIVEVGDGYDFEIAIARL
jgi:hypothetical protein